MLSFLLHSGVFSQSGGCAIERSRRSHALIGCMFAPPIRRPTCMSYCRRLSTPPANASTEKEEQLRDKNAKGIKHLTGQIPSALAPFFQCNASHCRYAGRRENSLYRCLQQLSGCSRHAGVATRRKSRRSRRQPVSSRMSSSSTSSRNLSVSLYGLRMYKIY